MKLLTINVHAWLEENQMEKIDILARTIAEKQYDVIAMQEVNQLMNNKIIFDGRVINNSYILNARTLKKDNNGKYKNIPKKYRRGNYYVQKGKLILNVYIKFPQGGGKTKEILLEEYNAILYFRNNNECEKSIRLTPINAKYNQQ